MSRQELEAELSRRGIRYEEVRPLLPDLEDVFVELTLRQQQQEAARV